jgi:hypothetical protein
MKLTDEMRAAVIAANAQPVDPTRAWARSDAVFLAGYRMGQHDMRERAAKVANGYAARIRWVVRGRIMTARDALAELVELTDRYYSANAIYADTDLEAAIESARAILATPEQSPPREPTREALDAMVDRFLAWPLPKDFAPDCGINFDGRGPDARGYDRGWPIGTNLFTAEQARAMFLHALAAPAAEAVAQPVDGDATKACISALRLVSELEAGRLPNDVFRAVDSALEMVDAPKVTHEPTRQYWCWKHGAYGEGSCPLCAAEPVAQQPPLALNSAQLAYNEAPRADADANWLAAMALVESFDSPYGQRLKMIAARIESDAKRIRELEAKNGSLRELMNCYNLGGWTDAERLQSERDEARRELAASRERERALREMFKDGYVLALYDDHGSQVNAWHSPEEFIATIATPDSAAPQEPKQ